MARPRFAVMSMTDAAAERARGLIANADRPVIGLRVGVKNGGCGTTLDYETTKRASTFTFRNPNQVSACGCGESVSIQPASMPEQVAETHA